MVVAYVIRKFGNVNALEKLKINLKNPKDNEILIKHTVIGLNYIDIDQRSGKIPLKLPNVPGVEAVGIIEKIGNNPTHYFKPGDRVCYCTAPSGAYSHKRIIDSKYLVKPPKWLSDIDIAAFLLKGMIAHYLLNRTFIAKKRSILLIHDSASPIGQLLTQWGKFLKCKKIIGTTLNSLEDSISTSNGCNTTIRYTDPDFVKKIYACTDNKGVSVVYDSIGYKITNISLASLEMFGIYVMYDNTACELPNLNTHLLSRKSLFVTRTSALNYKKNNVEFALTALEIFELLRKKVLKFNNIKKYSFDNIPKAHKDLESGTLKDPGVILIE